MLQTSVSFLRELSVNNNKEWFDAHRDIYQTAQTEFNQFVDQLIGRIRLFDSGIGSITAKDCVYRIYRDVRFSPDKTPYKNHFGAYIAPGGRKSNLVGYYLHIQPSDEQSLWGGGAYCPNAADLKAIRTDIYEHIDEYKTIVDSPDFISTLQWFEGGQLRSAPKGFPKDFPDINYLKRKDYTFYSRIDPKMIQNDLLEESVRTFKKMLPFNNFVNRAIRYHQEQDAQ